MRFNLYFLILTLVLWGSAACNSPEAKRKKEATLLRIHLEADERAGRSREVPVFRSRPVLVTIDREPVLDEGYVLAAAVMDQPGGGHAIQLQFDRQGTWLLERASVTHKGKRAVIHAQFGESRWLAAPILTHHMQNGLLTFTPDATREESERIVRGLNNVARKIQKKKSW